MIIALWLVCTTVAAAVSNLSSPPATPLPLAQPTVIELVKYDDFFFVEANMNNYGAKRLLFDTNSPTVLIKAGSSSKKSNSLRHILCVIR